MLRHPHCIRDSDEQRAQGTEQKAFLGDRLTKQICLELLGPIMVGCMGVGLSTPLTALGRARQTENGFLLPELLE